MIQVSFKPVKEPHIYRKVFRDEILAGDVLIATQEKHNVSGFMFVDKDIDLEDIDINKVIFDVDWEKFKKKLVFYMLALALKEMDNA